MFSTHNVVNLIAYLGGNHVLHKNSLIIRDTGIILLQTLKTENLLFVVGFDSIQLGDELVGERDVEGGDAPRRDQLVEEITSGGEILQTGHIQEVRYPPQHQGWHLHKLKHRPAL